MEISLKNISIIHYLLSIVQNYSKNNKKTSSVEKSLVELVELVGTFRKTWDCVISADRHNLLHNLKVRAQILFTTNSTNLTNSTI